MSATVFLEGGGDSKDLQSRCREEFRKLLEKCDLVGRMPRLVACGGREGAFADFQTEQKAKDPGHWIAMLIDSEEPVADLEKTWAHLAARDKWAKPKGASDEQVLFMTTCMETWIITDRELLTEHYGKNLQVSVLPPITNMESRARRDVQTRLTKATRKCANAYSKGKRSFEVLGKLDPATLAEHLPSFVRALRILKKKLRAVKT